MRFHAEVGTDSLIEAAYDFEEEDEEYEPVQRRRSDDWAPAEARPGYAHRAS
jgi:hypothetical protein